jgi:hypothetical protein
MIRRLKRQKYLYAGSNQNETVGVLTLIISEIAGQKGENIIYLKNP